MPSPSPIDDQNEPTREQTEQVIARQLTGELFCLSCGYNLRGLSIRSECPECGVPVRATILGIVDPHADELLPLRHPRVSAIGLCCWSFGATLAVAMIWLLRGIEVLRDMGMSNWIPSTFAWLGIAGLLLSMLGGTTMIRPHRGVTRREAFRSALGVSFYAPLIFVYHTIYIGHDVLDPSPLLAPGGDAMGRSILRVLMFVLVAGIVWGLRPAAIGLAIRSVIVRTGRVDRQSLLTLLASLGVAALGDLLAIISVFTPVSIADMLSIVSVVIISLGSVLFSVGMVNACIDTIRLYPMLARPGVGLADIFETNRQKSRRVEGI